ncbi:MAG TPA: hypothetical protein VLR90_13105 [Blastocatellia bacterium]|nr:hypothetical protein [Blastocatellia bacterium]
MAHLITSRHKQGQVDAFGYVSWLLTVQMLGKLLTKGLISSDEAGKMIESTAELAYQNSFTTPEDVETVLSLTCDILGLPHDADKSKESEESSSDG